jgi:hypothetical protein
MSGTTTNCAGLYLTPYCNKGTITNFYGLKIDSPSSGGTMTNQWPIYTGWNAQHYFGGDIYTVGNCSALSFTDRTPWYEGDALDDVRKMSGVDGEIDHDTLPEFAKAVIEGEPIRDTEDITAEHPKGVPIGKSEEVGRDIGAMVSILVVAVKQLTEYCADLDYTQIKQQDTIAALEARLAALEAR